jgi:hypothetical protein
MFTMTMKQKTFDHPEEHYPTGRPQFFALHYLHQVLREDLAAAVPPLGFKLLTRIVLEEDHNFYRSPATFFNDDLTRTLGCSEDTLDRTRRALIGLGLLRYERRSDRRSGVYWVVQPIGWEPIRRVGADGRMTRTGADANADVSADASADPKSPKNLNPKTLQPPTPKAAPQSVPEDRWLVVAEKLNLAGVLRVTLAIENARRNGFTADMMLAAIEWYLRPANKVCYGPGVLFDRFRTPDARFWSADDGWPPPNPQAEQQRKRLIEAEKAAEAKRRADADAVTSVAASDKWKQLELNFGDELDSLSDQERLELVKDQPQVHQAIAKRPAWAFEPGMFRQALLEAIAKRKGAV